MRECILNAPEKATLVSGVAGPAVPAVLQAFLSRRGAPELAIVVCRKSGEAEAWAETLKFFDAAFGGGKLDTLLLPADDESGDDARAFDIRCDRLDALARLAARERNRAVRSRCSPHRRVFSRPWSPWTASYVAR
jgi:hypothetical protein